METKKETDYSKLLFIMVVGACAMGVLGSIFYISIDAGFSINSNAEHKTMAFIWIIWNYLVPMLLFIYTLLITICNFEDTLFPDNNEESKEEKKE